MAETKADAVEIRCEGNKLHAKVLDDGRLEFACTSRWCGATPQVVVRHRWNPTTQELTTEKFINPKKFFEKE